MTTPINEVIDLLNLEELELNLFRGNSPQTTAQRVFGGQVVSQALTAANRTVEGRLTHSIKGDFLRPGNPKIPIIFEVDRIRDGRSFTTRRVVAIQKGRAIFSMSVNYQLEEAGFEHQFPMPEVPGPEEVPSPAETLENLKGKLPSESIFWYELDRPIDQRPVEPINPIDPAPREPQHAVWLKANGELPADQALHQAVFAYASDLTLLDTCTLPHAVSWLNTKFQSASLDHCIWFHRPFRIDEWVLMVQDSPAAAGSRGFNRSLVYTEAGELVASVVQEGLIRLND